MALITPSANISEIRGKVGDQIFSRNKFRSYVKVWSATGNPNTASQQNVRTLLSSHSQDWSLLTDEIRIEWNNFAADINTKRRLSGTSKLTGHVSFCKYSMIFDYTGFDSGYAPSSPIAWSSLISKNISADASDMDYSIVTDQAQARFALMFFMSKPVSAGIMSPNSVPFFFVESAWLIEGDVAGSLTSQYESRFSLLLSDNVGKKVFWYAKIVDMWNGLSIILTRDSFVIQPL